MLEASRLLDASEVNRQVSLVVNLDGFDGINHAGAIHANKDGVRKAQSLLVWFQGKGAALSGWLIQFGLDDLEPYLSERQLQGNLRDPGIGPLSRAGEVAVFDGWPVFFLQDLDILLFSV